MGEPFILMLTPAYAELSLDSVPGSPHPFIPALFRSRS